MKHHNILKLIFAFLGALLLCPLCIQAQTMRGDVNMDGTVGMDDLSAMINVLLTGSYGEPRPEDRDTITVNGVSFVMVRVEGGTYSSDALDYCLHTVETFSIGQTEVTVGLWTAVMEALPNGQEFHPETPVINMSWNQCQEFISRLNAVTGLNFRLPTLAEWEYAATGGKFTHGYCYSGSDNLDEVGWYSKHSDGYMHHMVGLLKPNELGLYDMSGNACEWCQDNLGTEAIPMHGVRGGSDITTERPCRATFWPTGGQYTATGDNVIQFAGLRLAL